MIIRIFLGGDNPDEDAKKEIYNRLLYMQVLAMNAIEATLKMGLVKTAYAADDKLEEFNAILLTLQMGWEEFTPEDFAIWADKANNVYAAVKLLLLDQN